MKDKKVGLGYCCGQFSEIINEGITSTMHTKYALRIRLKCNVCKKSMVMGLQLDNEFKKIGKY